MLDDSRGVTAKDVNIKWNTRKSCVMPNQYSQEIQVLMTLTPPSARLARMLRTLKDPGTIGTSQISPRAKSRGIFRWASHSIPVLLSAKATEQWADWSYTSVAKPKVFAQTRQTNPHLCSMRCHNNKASHSWATKGESVKARTKTCLKSSKNLTKNTWTCLNMCRL